MYTHAHSSAIHNRQETKATQASINEWTNKENVVYTYIGILFSLRKDRHPAIFKHIDEPGGQYAERNKPDTEE